MLRMPSSPAVSISGTIPAPTGRDEDDTAASLEVHRCRTAQPLSLLRLSFRGQKPARLNTESRDSRNAAEVSGYGLPGQQ